jgi:hypothetical protein
MATALAAALEKLAPLHFPQITFFAAREVVRELSASSSDAAIEKHISGLSSAHQDVLMKVLYVALASDSKNSTLYLKWHSALYTAAGPGAIMRVLTDKPPAATAE